MKKIILSFGVLLIAAVAMATPLRSAATCFSAAVAQVNEATDATPVIKAYMALKDALVAGQQKQAAEAGNALAIALGAWENQVDKKAFAKDGKDALKNAVAIGKATDVKAQRSSFKDLSAHLYALLKSSGTTTTLYWDYCPMAKANWLSDQKEIANPYYGNSMLTCGSVKETLEP